MGPGNRSTNAILLITTLILSAAIGLAIPLASGSQPGAELVAWTPPPATPTFTRTPVTPSPTIGAPRTRVAATRTPTWTAPAPTATPTPVLTEVSVQEAETPGSTPVASASPSTPEPLPATPTAQAMGTPNATPSVRILAERLNLRAGPGRDYPVSAVSTQGQEFALVGRNNEGDWLQVCCVEGVPLWLATNYVEVVGSLEDVPVVP